MPHSWVAIHRPDDYDPAAEGEAMGRDIAALNARMIAAGVQRQANERDTISTRQTVFTGE